jgi:hypothetical protein
MKVYSRRQLMAENYVGKAPNGYRWAEYIANNSTAYIDTGVNARNIVTSTLQMMATRKDSGNHAVYGQNYNSKNTDYIYVNGSTRWTILSNMTVVGLHTGYSFEFNRIYNLQISNKNAVSSDLTLYLFAAHVPSGPSMYFAGMRVYSCTMSVEGRIIKDFRPVCRLSDGKYGLYDIVNKQFHTSPNGVDFAGA